MSIYSYGITGTRHLDDIGEVSTIKFRYSRSWTEHGIAQQWKSDERYLARWAGRSFPRLVAYQGALYVWTSDKAIGDECIEQLRGNVLKYLPEAEVNHILRSLSWVASAIDAVDKAEIPYVPTSKREYELLTDAYVTLRLRESGDRNAQPLIKNNKCWKHLCKYNPSLLETTNA